MSSRREKSCKPIYLRELVQTEFKVIRNEGEGYSQNLYVNSFGLYGSNFVTFAKYRRRTLGDQSLDQLEEIEEILAGRDIERVKTVEIEQGEEEFYIDVPESFLGLLLPGRSYSIFFRLKRKEDSQVSNYLNFLRIIGLKEITDEDIVWLKRKADELFEKRIEVIKKMEGGTFNFFSKDTTATEEMVLKCKSLISIATAFTMEEYAKSPQ